MSVYVCSNCHFSFERKSDIESCPDCGRVSIRIASIDEKAEYLRNKSELFRSEEMKQDALDSVFEALSQRLLREEFFYLENNTDIKTIDNEKHGYRAAIEDMIEHPTENLKIFDKYMRVHSSYRDRQEMGMYIRGIKSVFDMLKDKDEMSSHDIKPCNEALTSPVHILDMIKGMENIDESLRNEIRLLNDLDAEIIGKYGANNAAVLLLNKYKETDAKTWDQWCVHVYETGINDCTALLKKIGLIMESHGDESL